jgi:hypothetical protein
VALHDFADGLLHTPLMAPDDGTPSRRAEVIDLVNLLKTYFQSGTSLIEFPSGL